MALNIKNPQVQELATELARLRGVSLTQAVLDAVQHELQREMNLRGRENLVEQLLEIGRRCARDMDPRISSADHATMLYDDQGLPR